MPDRARPDRFLRLRTMGGDGLAMLAASILAMAATAGLGYLVCLARVGTVALRAPTAPGPNVEGAIVVPGVRLRADGGVPADFERRLDRAARLVEAGMARGPVLLVGGSTGGPGRPSEAAVGRDWLTARGVAAGRIRCEEASRNTLENLRAVRATWRPGDGPALVVSNRYHLARLGVLAGGLGLPVALVAAEARAVPTPAFLGRLLLEAFFIHWYWTGRLLAEALGHRGMLGRIK